MRKQILTLVVAIVTILNVTAGANPTSANLYTVDLSSWNKAESTITIKNSDYQTIYTEIMAVGTVARKFNFTQLGNGTFFVMIDNAQKSETTEIMIKGDDVTTTETYVSYKPVFAVIDNTLKLNFLSLGEDATVSIYDHSEQQVLYKQKYNDLTTINKAYDLSRLNSGVYTVLVQTSNNTYSYEARK